VTASGSGNGTSTGSGSSSSSGGPEPVGGTVGMVVVDVQETFVSSATNADMAGIVERIKIDFGLAADHDVPFFVTYEASKTGDHSLHAPLQPVLPAHAQEFIKTTFDATGNDAFRDAVVQSALSHLVVVGAETDVCVLQTVLGLRQLGFTVLLQEDAVFTEETNTAPALRRMQQAGALLVDHAAVANYVEHPRELPAGGDHPVTILAPLQVGIVLNAFTDATLSTSNDPLTTQKNARLRELLLVSEWFELPVYVENDLPNAFASYFNGTLRPITQIAQDTAVTQLIFAGTDGSLSALLSTWQTSHDLFVMEDALLTLGTATEQRTRLQPFFARGLVPTTYKTFYYDMTKSVDLAEWPSPTWVQRFDEYYWITQAPEDLPPIPNQ